MKHLPQASWLFRHRILLQLMSVFVLAAAASAMTTADELAPVQKFLSEGRLTDASDHFSELLKTNEDDQQARFSLGVVQFLQAVEGLGYDHYRYGLLGDRRRQITFMRLPVPENPSPEKLNYEKARAIISGFVERLGIAEKTLADVKPTGVLLPLQVGAIRLDLDRNGKRTDDETLGTIIDSLQGPRSGAAAGSTAGLTIAFDDADVLWLRGYCHVMSGLGQIVLAYDWKDQFERTAHLFYPNVETPYSYLQAEGPGVAAGFNLQNITDLIALIHTVNYEVTEPARMQTALQHFETVITLSRESFRLIEAETDNDREWIPNEKQTSAVGQMRVGQGIVKGWSRFLDEMELILQGKKLLPFWRGAKGGIPIFTNSLEQVPVHPELGINVRRIFTEPKRFDAMLWLQGTGLHPFLEKGPRTDQKTWQGIMSEFGGDFVTFMFWFN